MRLTRLIAALAVAACGWLSFSCDLPAAAGPSAPEPGRPHSEGRDPLEPRRRRILGERLLDLGDRVRLVEREGAISRGKSAELYDGLADVEGFLRKDRHLTGSEFERRMDDLDEVERSLRSATGGRHNRRYR